MPNVLAKLVELNNWANRQIIRACAALPDDQLDATPQSAKQWSIRQNLIHMVYWQGDYLSLLTQTRGDPAPVFAELEQSAATSGEGLLVLARAEDGGQPTDQLETSDGYRVEPWVVMVQAIHHGIEHRKQIAHLMRMLGLDPPWQDGWAFGEATDAVVQISK